MIDLRQLSAAVEGIAREAGAILREGFGGVISATSKEGYHNLVTEYDVRVEQFLHERLSALVPDASFLGEEGGLREVALANADTLTWVVDPLDGTVNFAHGVPIFCVSIAAVIGSRPVLGVIYHPMLDEMFSAVQGGPALLNGRPLQVSTTTRLEHSLLVTGFPYNVDRNPRRCIEQFSSIVGQGLPIRRLGSAALDLAYTAAGRFDGFWEVELQPWDMMAGVLLVQQAGGTVTQYDHVPMELHASSIVATNGAIHHELIAALHAVEHGA